MNTYYLGLDLNLPQDIKIIKLKRKLGFSGFGLFIELQLKLAQSTNYELSKKDYADLAYEFRLEEKFVRELVEDFDLFEFKDDKFFILDIKEKMNLLAEKKRLASEAGKKGNEIRWGKVSGSDNTPISGSDRKPNRNKGNKEKEIKIINKDKEVKEILNFYNETFSKNFKTAVGWKKNFEFWLTHYNLDEIKTAIRNLNHPNWWANKPKNGEPAELAKLDFLFRRSNSKGDCDYIGELLNLGEVENKQEPENVYRMSRSKFATEEELQRELAYYAECLPQWKVILID